MEFNLSGVIKSSWGKLQNVLSVDDTFFATETRPKTTASRRSPVYCSFNRSYGLRTPNLKYSFTKSFNRGKSRLGRRIESDVNGMSQMQVKELFNAKCEDLGILNGSDQENRFFIFCNVNFRNRLFNMSDLGFGIESAKCIAKILVNNTHFAYINLCKNKLEDSGCLYLAKNLLKCLSLVHLDLSSNGLTSEGSTELLKIISCNENISSLNLCSHEGHKKNRLGPSGSKAICHYLHTSQVISILNISNTSIGPKGINYISKGLENNFTLRSLNISYNYIGHKGLEKLVEAIVSSNLNEILLAGNKIGNEGCGYLKTMLSGKCQGYCSLEKLDLSENEIETKGISQIFEGLKANNQLVYLNVRKNKLIGGLSSAFCEFLTENYTLKTLNLSYCEIKCDGLLKFDMFFYLNAGLEVLNLSGNQISDEGARIIAVGIEKNKKLTTLDLSFNKIKETGGMVIANSLEKNKSVCKVLLKSNFLLDSNAYKFSEVVRKNKKFIKFSLDYNPCSLRFVEYLERSLKLNKKTHKLKLSGTLKETISNLQVLNATFDEVKLKIAEKSQEKEVNEGDLNNIRIKLKELKQENRELVEALKSEYSELKASRTNLSFDLLNLTEDLNVI